MAKCHRNDVGSLALDRAVDGGGHFRLWTTFSGAAFRRKIFSSMRCGGGGGGGGSRHRGRNNYDVENATMATSSPPNKARRARSEKLSELLKISEPCKASVEESEMESRRKVEWLERLKGVVRVLDLRDGLEGAREVRLVAKEESEARATLAMLGAIPPLVGMVESENVECQIEALYALLNLGIGNDVNKAAIVKAGAVHKMLKLIEPPNESPNPSVAEAIVANFLGLSALDLNKPIVGSSGAIPFLVKTLIDLDNRSGPQAKQDSLRALYNLSIYPSNISLIVETDLIPFLMNKLGDMEVSERILSILSNVVSTPEGRKAISIVPDAFPILVDVLNWTDSPGCQEKATYILMVMAHKAYGDRQAMIEAGIVSSLLELTLLGSTLAQKRASRILECLRVDKGKQVSESYGGGLGAAVSAPICGGSSSSSAHPNHHLKECLEEEEDMMSEERKAVKQLVQQSLQNNMRRIVKRANLPQDFVPSDHFKSLTSSSTSKSLPF